MKKTGVSVISLLLFATLATAATRYVVPPGTPGVATASGYTSWETAATNIQHAVDTAETDDLILDKGVYRAWMAGAKDLAGNFRIIGAAVDMGAFEAPLSPGIVILVR